MDNDELFALNSIKGIGPKAVSIIIDHLKQYSVKSLKEVDIDFLLQDKNLTTKHKESIKENLPWGKFQRYVEHASATLYDIEKKGIDVVSINDANYPVLLKMTQDAPLFLYCKGNLSLMNTLDNIAVVGTRQCTSLGERITEKSVEFMCDNNYTIVSGLALGIDTIAHQAALNSGGKTISVLVDVDNVQPSSNRKLADDIFDNDGLLVAEMPPGTKIIPSMFAKRDRIQSGLSLAVFPIETDIDGGTMHAVKAALKENRLVYVPDVNQSGYSDLNIPQLGGIQYLIDESKAIPYTKSMYSDILNALELKKDELLNPKVEPKQGSLL